MLDTAAWITGRARETNFALLAAVVFLLTFAIGQLVTTQRDPLQSIFFATVILLAPAGLLLAWRQPFLYPRYFVLCAPFYYLLLARIAAAAFERRQHKLIPKIACGVFLLLFITGNAVHLADFHTFGRGQYLDAIQYMLRFSNNVTTVGALQDRRNALMFDFYKDHVPPNAHLEYRDAVAAMSQPPDWLIVDGVDWSVPDLDDRLMPSGARYTFDRKFAYAGLSGFDWYLFRRTPK